MKKIILILALLSLGVSKAQVVGGYLPLNSTKSATMGGLKVAGNETVTGTFSVGSTATITGGLKVVGASTIGTGQNNYFGAIISSQLESIGNGYIGNKLRVGNNTTPSATLDVTGTLGVSSTFSLGSANLTGGNTGTVAVLSDITVPYYFTPNTGLSPADNDLRYCGILMPNFSALYTATSAIGFYVNDNIEVVRYDIQAWNNGTVGSAENVTVSLVSGSSSTLGLLNNTITTNSQTQTTNTCSINVNSGTRILIEYKFPTYATNPTSLWLNTVLYTRRRQ